MLENVSSIAVFVLAAVKLGYCISDANAAKFDRLAWKNVGT